MKKYAFILMGKGYDTQEHKVQWQIGESLTAIFTVNSMEDAVLLVQQLQREGYGVIELCGAFAEDGAQKLMEATDNKVGIGFVKHFSQQDQLFDAFFSPSPSK